MAKIKAKPEAKAITGITLNEYLANHSRNRNLDNPIALWYQRKDPMNTLRKKEEWDKIIAKFYAEK